MFMTWVKPRSKAVIIIQRRRNLHAATEIAAGAEIRAHTPICNLPLRSAGSRALILRRKVAWEKITALPKPPPAPPREGSLPPPAGTASYGSPSHLPRRRSRPARCNAVSEGCTSAAWCI